MEKLLCHEYCKSYSFLRRIYRSINECMDEEGAINGKAVKEAIEEEIISRLENPDDFIITDKELESYDDMVRR